MLKKSNNEAADKDSNVLRMIALAGTHIVPPLKHLIFF